MPKLDLHSHTIASDGLLAPAELVRLAHEVGLTTLAVTDHDTTAGLAEARAAAEPLGIEIVNGVEFACEMPHGEIHILGYLFDAENSALAARLAWLREGRDERGREMTAKLNTLGVPVSWERVREIAGGAAVGRPHVAQALVEGGWATDMRDAFDRYIGLGGPAYAARRRMTPDEVIDLMRRAGGVASLAHPARIADLEQTLPSLVAAGLAGMEAYYGEYDPATVSLLVKIADRHNLVPTGGSDYHAREIKDHAMLGACPTVPADTVDRLRARQMSRIA
ncbi:MAG: PHP domain-containing protein [Chloroflexia bacterium]